MSALLKEERNVINLLDASIGLNGLRDNDDFSINIFRENKKSYKLNRVKYIIKSAEKFHFDFIKSEIHLPIFNSPQCEFELILTKLPARYLLRSKSGVPFRINGVWSFEAFIERGDYIDIGFNRFSFSKSFALKNDDLLNLVPKEIIESDLSIMIEGETGTGKTTLAKKVHDASGVAGDFVHLNLSSFSPGLLESELFGHVKGAFTGAGNNKKGAFLQAHRGTLFLDEVDSLPREIQTKLLLFLENFEVRPVGSEVSQKAEVRLVFASGSNLKALVEAKTIRADFYYRLISGYSIKLQSLAENKDAIRVFCKKFEQTEMVIISDDLISYYEKIDWPGNIRQLKSHLLKKKIFAQGKKIVFNNYDEELITNSKNTRNENLISLEKVKFDYCLNTFLKMDRNIKNTSQAIGVSQNTLRGILKKNDFLGADNVLKVNF
jgi:hypothetical protein